MRIKKITDEGIYFDNGDSIFYEHDQDCCENNYADFTVISRNDVNFDYDFDPDEMIFKRIEGAGFCFGNEGHLIFVPCYSEQNGYYSDEIEICYYDIRKNETKTVINNLECGMIDA